MCHCRWRNSCRWPAHKNKTEEYKDTLSIAFSSTKAALALCAHMLIERGQLN